jgi:hypothetical protein
MLDRFHVVNQGVNGSKDGMEQFVKGLESLTGPKPQPKVSGDVKGLGRFLGGVKLGRGSKKPR